MTMNRSVTYSVVLLLSLASHALSAGVAEYNLGRDRLALQGFDPVSYFDPSGPAKGIDSITLDHAGVIYRFASVANRDRFKAKPASFLPTYGGWCATAMAKGEKVEIDPRNYKITKGRLFLFYSGFWGNAKKDWHKDEGTLTTKADARWKNISGE